MAEVQQTVAPVEEVAPALPTTEPPVEDPKPETIATEAADTETVTTEAANGEAVAGEKRTSRLKKRLTLKWGKNRDQNETPKEPQAPADPHADVSTWISQQIPVAVHKVNHMVLDWIQKVAVEDESARQALPGKDGQVTRNQFLAFLRDGNLLTQLANKLQPGAIEPVVAEEGADAAKQKEVQTENVQKFATWAQQTTGAEEGKAMTAADLLEKGKTGYSAVFDTIWTLGLKAQEKFEKENIDVDAIVSSVAKTVRTSIIDQIVSFFRRKRTPAEITAATETQEQNNVEAAENHATEPAVTEKVEESVPAVAAN